ncbi:xanthomonadin biosynthesis protein [Dokdonella sp.]|uniref:xanthomonadin biosynthesis protein n=1 Tax=Dokdonella sp. TaxID=2291710 RepID=UPI001B132309|nr:xanthomonadin biosynthesis protein [Dokdonella sp.]MBO9661817.1 xanthomonadin biosynthesis protein [Dokdonella sp.]
MSIIAPTTPSTSLAPRSRWLAFGLAVYVVSLAAALASGNVWLDTFAALVLVTLLLSPGLRRRSGVAWVLWLLAGASFLALAACGHGRLALDVLPIFVNAALCLLFARTLARGREPLIARIIEVLEGRERLALPRVAAYARGLTLAWALLFGAQATLLALLLTFARPDGLLDALGLAAPFVVAGSAWRWYLHVGSYALVLTFLVLEYAFRRRYLAHLPHAPMAQFIARLMRRWPALVRRFADEMD